MLTTVDDVRDAMESFATNEEIEHLLQEIRLGAVLDLVAAAMPDALGSTRFGGLPDRVPGQPWPRDRHGAPMQFVAQFDVASLPLLSIPGLPRDGLIILFATRCEVNIGAVHRQDAVVEYIEAGAALERSVLPVDAVEAFDPPLVRAAQLPSASIGYQPTIMLDRVPFRDGALISLETYAAFDALARRSWRIAGPHHLLGGVPVVPFDEPDLLIDCARASREQRGTTDEFVAACRAWYQFVQFDDDFEIGLDWMEYRGGVHFCVGAGRPTHTGVWSDTRACFSDDYGE